MAASRHIAPTFLATLILVVPAFAADWPGWRGANRDAVSSETGLLQEWAPGGPPLAWKASGIGTGFSSVSVVGDRIYTAGDKDGAQLIFALDRNGGKVLWKAKLGPTFDERRGGGPRGTPVVDGDRVFALGTEGDLVCLDAATGQEIWRKSLPRDFGGQMMSRWRWSESPLVDGDRLVFTPGARDAALVAVDKATGREIWRAAIPDLGPEGKDGAGYSSVVVSNGAGVKQYVQLMGRGVVGIRASDGKFLWGYNRVANGTANVSTPIVRGNLVFASTGYRTGSVLLELERSGDGVKAGERYFLDAKTLQNHHGGLVLVGDHIYAGHGHNKGFPICVELESGKVAWGGDIRNDGTDSATVVYADGRVYFRYQNGVILLVEATPGGYVEKGTLEIPDVTSPSWPHLAISDGHLYVREQDDLYAYDLRDSSRKSANIRTR
ncbi:MAG: PQQ-binding-like beta-propeller repeat protein [Vicinamibacteria bacterium]